jgi:hypothetical protein
MLNRAPHPAFSPMGEKVSTGRMRGKVLGATINPSQPFIPKNKAKPNQTKPENESNLLLRTLDLEFLWSHTPPAACRPAYANLRQLPSPPPIFNTSNVSKYDEINDIMAFPRPHFGAKNSYCHSTFFCYFDRPFSP